MLYLAKGRFTQPDCSHFSLKANPGRIQAMVTIRRIRPGEAPAVMQLICRVAYGIFGFDGTLEDSQRHFKEARVFQDMEDVRENYFENGGTFLVAVEDGEIIGSGALRRLSPHTAELKRMWLLERYHSQGIGWQLMARLIVFAREQDYTCIRLQTSPQQKRALAFYRKVGFTEIPNYTGEVGEISLEFAL